MMPLSQIGITESFPYIFQHWKHIFTYKTWLPCTRRSTIVGLYCPLVHTVSIASYILRLLSFANATLESMSRILQLFCCLNLETQIDKTYKVLHEWPWNHVSFPKISFRLKLGHANLKSLFAFCSYTCLVKSMVHIY